MTFCNVWCVLLRECFHYCCSVVLLSSAHPLLALFTRACTLFFHSVICGTSQRPGCQLKRWLIVCISLEQRHAPQLPHLSDINTVDVFTLVLWFGGAVFRALLRVFSPSLCDIICSESSLFEACREWRWLFREISPARLSKLHQTTTFMFACSWAFVALVFLRSQGIATTNSDHEC